LSSRNLKIDFKTDERFNILNVANKLNIKIVKPVRNCSKFIAICPFCDDKSGHLYLTIENGSYNNVFKCVKCSESGSAVQLYAKLRNIDTIAAVKELCNEDVDRKSIKVSEKAIINQKKNNVNEVKSDKILNCIYTEFLNKLTLNDIHKKNMLDRGLFYSTIKSKQYRSIPNDYNTRQNICRELQVKYGENALCGISGFFFNRKVGKWDFYAPKGMLIPCRNLNGEIVTLQIRLDEIVDKQRYKNFSSAGFYKGTPCYAHVHVAYNKEKSVDNIIVTEGPIKADITCQLMNRTVLALPGVGALHKELISILKEFNANSIDIAFDMDILDKVPVQKALNYLQDRLDEENIEYTQLLWKDYYLKDKKLKGIDDYLAYKYNIMVSKVFS